MGGTPVPPELCRPSYSQTTPANARVQGLPSNSSYGRLASRRFLPPHLRRGPVACFGPVPGSTAASAVLIGALADETPLNSGTPGEAVAAATATREGACGPRDGQIHQLLRRPSYSPTTPASARVQGLPISKKKARGREAPRLHELWWTKLPNHCLKKPKTIPVALLDKSRHDFSSGNASAAYHRPEATRQFNR